MLCIGEVGCLGKNFMGFSEGTLCGKSGKYGPVPDPVHNTFAHFRKMYSLEPVIQLHWCRFGSAVIR